MSLDLKLIGNNIKKRRKELGITQKDIAEALNISQGYIADLENGKIKNPTVENLDKISGFLDMHLSDIFGYGVRNTEIKGLSSAEAEYEPKNPDIRRIFRAGNKLSKEQAETLRKVAESLFPEAFKDE